MSDSTVDRRFRWRVTGCVAICAGLACFAWWLRPVTRVAGLNYWLLTSIRTNDLQGIVAAIQQGADPNAKHYTSHPPINWYRLFPTVEGNPDFNTPLYSEALWPIERGIPAPDRPETLALLISHGADPNARDYMGRTPLMRAVSKHNGRCVLLLMGAGVDPDARDSYGMSALHLAAIDDVGALRALLPRVHDLNVKNVNGDTAAMYAAGNKNGDTLSALIAAGADLNVVANDGKTALDIANDRRDPVLAGELRARGAKRSNELAARNKTGP